MTRATQNLGLREPVIFDVTAPGRRGDSLPASAHVSGDVAIPQAFRRTTPLGWPEVSEPEAVRHFVRLSQQNYGVDTGMFPLGSCTMKYNPKVNEDVARLPGFADLHPLAPDAWTQGALELMWNLERYLSEIAGFHAVTLAPAAGAHGEFTGLALFRRRLIERDGDPRKKILVPDTAHGTNPASGALNGYKAVSLASSDDGVLRPEVVAAAMDESVAGIMITNPNTLGVFERHIAEIAEIVHAKGGFVYLDGANLNALMGHARPGDMGVDAMHFNLHKTFSTPHGGGGPGAGPVGTTAELAPLLPVPRVVRDDGGTFRLEHDRPRSIGRVKAFHGNFGVLARAYAYIRELGAEGLKLSTEMDVLNAKYLRVRPQDNYHVVQDRTCMHEVVLTDRNQRRDTGVETKDIAKGLIDRGFHPPTVYFPICVHNAIMIEPTESESLRELDAFVGAMLDVDREAREAPERVKAAPTLALVGRLDETRAVRKPRLRWKPAEPSE